MSESYIMELIQITVTEKGTRAVSARELHRGLESKQDFSTWIKKRLDDIGAIDGTDYLLHKKMEQLDSGAKHLIEYIVTIDIAKHIAMMEKNEKGKEFRQYFIDYEKKQSTALPSSPMEILELVFKANKETNAKVDELFEKIEVLETSTTLDHAMQQKLQKAVSKRVHELIKLHNLSDTLKPGLFSSIYGNIKEQYHVPSYKDVPKVKYSECLLFVDKVNLKGAV